MHFMVALEIDDCFLPVRPSVVTRTLEGLDEDFQHFTIFLGECYYYCTAGTGRPDLDLYAMRLFASPLVSLSPLFEPFN